MQEEIIVRRPRCFLPKQVQVFNLVFNENKDDKGKTINNYVLYSGAFGSGKTLLLAHVGIKAALDYPGSIGFVGSLTYNQIRDVVFRKFCQEVDLYQKSLDEANIPVKIVKTITMSPGKMNIVFNNGSEIWFRSCDNERNLAGKDLDWFAIDEPVDVDESVMTQLIGRLRHDKMSFHFGVLATNPGAENHWLYKYFFMDKIPGYFVVETSTYDNILIPNYDAYIASMKSRYDADWVRRYLEGKWGAFSGQIYKMFNMEKHVKKFDIEDFTNIDKFIAGVDFGIRDPCCILIIAQTVNNNLYVVDEYYESEKSSTEIVKQLVLYHKKYKFNRIYCDPSAADLIKQGFDRGLPIGRFEGDGKVISFANNQVLPGISLVQAIIKNDRLTINSKCRNLIRSLLAYRYKQDGEQPFKDDDHAADALRYAVSDYKPFSDSIFFSCGKWRKKRWH